MPGHEEPRAFRGRVVSGAGEGARFLSLDWVRAAIRGLGGFDPYPGTLNLRLLEAETPRWRGIRGNAGARLVPPEPGGCGGRLIPVRLAGAVDALVVVPDITRYGDDLVEVVAPEHLRTRLALRDGDVVSLTIATGSPGRDPSTGRTQGGGAGATGMGPAHTAVGRPVARVEGPAKVTGAARYAADVKLPGLLWARVVRSALPHARLLRVDADKARALPGVRAVLTATELPDVLVGRRMCDMPLLARGRVRFVGEPVAVIAADDPEVAEEATTLVEVDYEELPAVVDPLAALAVDAPVLHDDPGGYAGAPAERSHPNVQSVHRERHGDPQRAFRDAARVFEHTFRTPLAHQGYLEPRASLVAIDPDGRVQVWTCNKTPFRFRAQLAHALGLPPQRIRLNLLPIGGDFGGKGFFTDPALAYFLARATGRPVKLVLSYTEELLAANPRHPSVITLRTGVDRDGRIVARTARAVFDGGAYAAFKPRPKVELHGAAQAGGVYRVPHFELESIVAYTNSVPCGHARAPGEPQTIFAVESHMDMIARELGLDPVEFRRRNLIGEGERLATGERVRQVRARETLDAALSASGWETPKAAFTGRGLALSHRFTGGGESNARIRLEADGTVRVITSTPDTGTGAHTVFQQIAAEALGVPLERVVITVGDTDTFTDDAGVGGSRVTHVGGQAVYRAALTLRETLAGGTTARPVEAAGHWSSRDTEGVTAFCAQVAEVEVDPETGQVRLRRMVTVHDAGTVINPIGHQGQIEGGLVQGLGLALMEELRTEDGRIGTLSLGDYKLPVIKDVPPLTTIVLEDPAGPGPFRAKAIGEMSISPVPAAIANAVFDACGVRLTELPVTAEKVFFALRARGAAP